MGGTATKFGNCWNWGVLIKPARKTLFTDNLQVITGFVATGYITLIMVVVYYLFDHNKTTNVVDRVFINGVGRLSGSLSPNSTKPELKWSEAIEFAVLMFSDQQIVTGIAILLSGYTQLNCALSTYHWEIVVYLAWFSSTTHLITLTALRSYFRKRVTLTYWRVFFMGCLVVLLGAALGPTGFVYFLNPGVAGLLPMSVPALCLFSSTGPQEAYQALESQGYPGGELYLHAFNWLYILLALLFLVVSYLSRVSSLFRSTDDRAESRLRIRLGYWLKREILAAKKISDDSKGKVSQTIWLVLSVVMMAAYILLKVMYEISTSMIWEVRITSDLKYSMKLTLRYKLLWLTGALAWGTLRLLATWQSSHLLEENLWGFGQVMALLLIALPFLSLSEQLFDGKFSSSLKL
jgi:hypothetical protein